MGLFDKEEKENSSEQDDLFGRPLPGAEAQPSGKRAPQQSVTASAPGMMDQMGSLNRRLKMLEERSQNISKRMQLTDHNMIEGTKKLHAEIRAHTGEIQEIRETLREIKEKIALIIREFKNVPRKEDMKVLEKYVTLWNPMEFVTRKQAEKIIKQMMEEQEDEE